MKSRGFTLIEPVMVIAILGVLAAVSLPEFVDLKADAGKAVVVSSVGAIAAARILFVTQAASCGSSYEPRKSLVWTQPSPALNNLSAATRLPRIEGQQGLMRATPSLQGLACETPALRPSTAQTDGATGRPASQSVFGQCALSI